MAVTLTLKPQQSEVYETTTWRTETEGDPSFPDPSALVLQRGGISPPGSSSLHPAPEGQNQTLINFFFKKRKKGLLKLLLFIFFPLKSNLHVIC